MRATALHGKVLAVAITAYAATAVNYGCELFIKSATVSW
jgi:hypothetical protein